MTLKAQIRTDALGNITVHMDGDLSYDNHRKLKNEIIKISEEHPYSTITLDLNSLDFVGSSGISNFVEMLKSLNKNGPDRYKISNIKSEFIKVFQIYNFNALEMMAEEFSSDETYNLSQKFGTRKRTFEN